MLVVELRMLKFRRIGKRILAHVQPDAGVSLCRRASNTSSPRSGTARPEAARATLSAPAGITHPACSRSMNSCSCASRARMPFTFHVAIFIPITLLIRGGRCVISRRGARDRHHLGSLSVAPDRTADKRSTMSRPPRGHDRVARDTAFGLEDKMNRLALICCALFELMQTPSPGISEERVAEDDQGFRPARRPGRWQGHSTAEEMPEVRRDDVTEVPPLPVLRPQAITRRECMMSRSLSPARRAAGRRFEKDASSRISRRPGVPALTFAIWVLLVAAEERSIVPKRLTKIFGRHRVAPLPLSIEVRSFRANPSASLEIASATSPSAFSTAPRGSSTNLACI